MKKLSLLILPLVALFLSSCVSFEHNWDKSVADYHAGKITSPAGPWEGNWATKTNGHTGNLRAIVTPSGKYPGEYDFHYHATWKEIFSGAYKVRYPVTGSRGRYLANGQEKLGIFGTFEHKATITGNSFKATYSNDKGDLGNFSLKRPE